MANSAHYQQYLPSGVYKTNGYYYIPLLTIMPFVDIIISIMMKTPQELLQSIAHRAKAKRLALNLTQVGLEQRSGVSLGTIKLFERTGKISLESLLKLATALGATKEFESLFVVAVTPATLSLDALMQQPKMRKRGSLT